MTTSVPIRLKIDMNNERSKGDAGFQWPEEQRKYWIVAMFCGTLLLYAARSAVPLCMAAMSSDMNWDKEIDVSNVPCEFTDKQCNTIEKSHFFCTVCLLFT